MCGCILWVDQEYQISFFSAIFATAITLLVGPTIYWIIPNRINGNLEANYYLRKIRVEYLAKGDGSGSESNKIQSLLKVHQYWEDWCRAEGLRYATVISEWESVIYVLGRTKGDLRGAGINSGVTSGLVIM